MPKESKVSRPKSLSKKWLYAVILVIVILACAVVYTTSYYTSHNNAAVMTGNSFSTQGNTQPPVDGQTFTIPELGIQMTLPEGLEGLEYSVETNSQDSRVLYANFVTADIIEKNSGDTRCSIGTIARWTSDPGELGSSARAILVGKYYYSYTSPQQPCVNADATYSMQQQQSSLLQKAFNTVGKL